MSVHATTAYASFQEDLTSDYKETTCNLPGATSILLNCILDIKSSACYSPTWTKQVVVIGSSERGTERQALKADSKPGSAG